MAYPIWGGGSPCCLNKVFRPHVEDSGPDPLLLLLEFVFLQSVTLKAWLLPYGEGQYALCAAVKSAAINLSHTDIISALASLPQSCIVVLDRWILFIYGYSC
jgi:hypothetical protein